MLAAQEKTRLMLHVARPRGEECGGRAAKTFRDDPRALRFTFAPVLPLFFFSLLPSLPLIRQRGRTRKERKKKKKHGRKRIRRNKKNIRRLSNCSVTHRDLRGKTSLFKLTLMSLTSKRFHISSFLFLSYSLRPELVKHAMTKYRVLLKVQP